MTSLMARWRQTVVSYDNHSQAGAAVDTLVQRGFPPGELSIVAEDVRCAGGVRRGYLQTALGGAAFGAVLVTLAAHGLAVGAVAGAALATLAHRLSRGTHVSAGAVESDRYTVVCDGETADEAASILRSAWRS
jgi:hypothetical protein